MGRRAQALKQTDDEATVGEALHPLDEQPALGRERGDGAVGVDQTRRRASTAAHAVAVLPSGVLKIPRSFRIRTRTGKAVILMLIPMNKAKARKLAPGCASSW